MKSSISPAELLKCAVLAVKTAGNHALRNKARRIDVVGTFKHDIKLRLDVECQEKAEAVIASRFPKHLMLGEEDPDYIDSIVSESDYQWIIDPIDGTVNFAHGLPWWCCSVAVRRGSRMLAGAVFAPDIGDLYTSRVDGPALRNGKPIKVSKVKELGASLLLTGLAKNVEPGTAPFETFENLSESVQKTRIYGSAALDLCQVAAGRADGYFEAGIYLWDVAAAGLIVRRAGGKADIIKNQDHGRICFAASNGRVHSALLKKLNIKP